MIRTEQDAGTRYRVWMVRYEGPPPVDWHVVPVAAVALGPAETGVL